MFTNLKARAFQLVFALALFTLGAISFFALSTSVSHAQSPPTPTPNLTCGSHSSSCSTCSSSGGQWYCQGSVAPSAGFTVGDCFNYLKGSQCADYTNVSCGAQIRCGDGVKFNTCAGTDDYCQ